tara:strand:- start:4122 stop:5291 length:1170 start_codon:yes stop_codon:yes gene_type:complete
MNSYEGHDNIKQKSGFTLLELTAVLVILSALTSVAIPNVNKWIKLSRIDEAKGSLNFAAANCLQSLRSGEDLSEKKVVGSDISNDQLNVIGYKVKSEKDKCSEFLIEPSNSDDPVLFTFGFRINENGDVTKIAFPNDRDDSLNSCKKWAGVNCGISAAQQAEWDRLAALAKAKNDCNETFYTWLNDTAPNGGSGKNVRWDDNAASCTQEAWAFEGSVVNGEKGYNSALERKLGQECSKKIKENYADTKYTNPQDASGESLPITISECGSREFWFVEGVDQGTKADYASKIAANKELKCKNDRETVRQQTGSDSFQGKYGPFEGPGACGEIVWICDGKVVNSERAYKTETVCGRAETESACGGPPFPNCTLQKWWGWWQCEAWSSCMGLI